MTIVAPGARAGEAAGRAEAPGVGGSVSRERGDRDGDGDRDGEGEGRRRRPPGAEEVAS